MDKEFKTLFLDNVKMKLKSGENERGFLLNVFEDCIEIQFLESNNQDPLSINIILKNKELKICKKENQFIETIYTQKENKSEN